MPTQHPWKITCMANLFPACEPPLITLKAGTGNTRFLLPARLAICCRCKEKGVNHFITIIAEIFSSAPYAYAHNLVKRNLIDSCPSFTDCKGHSKNSICSELIKEIALGINRVGDIFKDNDTNHTFCLHQPHSFLVPSSSCTMKLSITVCSVGFYK